MESRLGRRMHVKLGRGTTPRGHFFLKKGAFSKNEGGTFLFIAKSWGRMPPVPPVLTSMKAGGLLAVLFDMFYENILSSFRRNKMQRGTIIYSSVHMTRKKSHAMIRRKAAHLPANSLRREHRDQSLDFQHLQMQLVLNFPTYIHCRTLTCS